MTQSVTQSRQIHSTHHAICQAIASVNQRIIGQEKLILRLFIALLSDGHLLVEGAPGLAKTSAIKALSDVITGDFHRIQFTPDLLPGDLTGTDIYRLQTGDFHFQQGPLFHHLLLADEINRAPAKVQSALLEAMAERQITIGKTTYSLPDLFLVMATQNPIEQEGTYPLPEAQLDRFLFYIHVGYPDLDSEKAILALAREQAKQPIQPEVDTTLSQDMVFEAREAILSLHMSDQLADYIVQLVHATRHIETIIPQLAPYIRFGASPRATIGLDRAARAHAWLYERDYVAPDDIHAIAHDILRHRILLNFNAQAEGITTDHIISELLQQLALP